MPEIGPLGQALPGTPRALGRRGQAAPGGLRRRGGHGTDRGRRLPGRAAGCSFIRVRGGELCDAHQRSYAWLRWHWGGLDMERFLAHVQAGRERTAPRFDLRGVQPVVALELGYALQCRHDRRGPAITPLIHGPVNSMLTGSDAAWAPAAEQRFPKASRRNPLAWVRFCRKVLRRLRDERRGGEVWD